MWPCARLYGHSGSHITERGCEFVDDKSLGYTPIPEMLDIKVIDETVSPDRISIKPISNET
jgi:hypothetical protein